MLPKKKESGQLCLFFSFADTLIQKHPLYILVNQIDWSVFEKTFSPLYSADKGRPAKPIRLMVGLLLLKHIRNLSEAKTYYQKQKLSQAHRKRAGIEPVIGHLKTDHRLKRIFYKGVLGDKVNIMLAAAAFNFKRMMNRYKIFFWLFFQRVFHTFYRLAGYFFFTKKIKMTFSGTTT